MRSRRIALLGVLLAAVIALGGSVPNRSVAVGPAALPADGSSLSQETSLSQQTGPLVDPVGEAREQVPDRRVEVARPTPWGPDLPRGAAALAEERVAPVRLVVDALDVDVPVIEAGLTDAGALDLPPDATTVAWFANGVVPGESGSAVIAGHVDYDGVRGALFELAKSPSGTEIAIEFDDGTLRRFVTDGPAVAYPKTSLPIDEIFRRDGPPTLTLVTCGGRFDRRTRSYADNVVVVAVPMSR